MGYWPQIKGNAMRKLSAENRAMILSALVEGNNINATAHPCGPQR